MIGSQQGDQVAKGVRLNYNKQLGRDEVNANTDVQDKTSLFHSIRTLLPDPVASARALVPYYFGK